MEFLGHALLAIFIALVVFAALSFGFMLFIWFAGLAFAAWALVMMRAWLQRLWFLYATRDRSPPRKNHVIEVDYRDISDDE